MPTIKDLITEKYLELQENLINNHQIQGLFPSLDDVDIADLLYFFNLKFTSTNTEFRKAKLVELSQLCKVDITNEQLDRAFEDINNFINFLVDIQKKK